MDIPSFFKAVHKLDGAVMTDLHAVRQFADARPDASRHALDGQQQLVLAALHARLLYYLFAEMEGKRRI